MAKIMYVDDSNPMRALIIAELEDRGHEVVDFRSPADIKKKIRRERPDVLILDRRLGKYDGFGVLQELREDSDNYHLPVILYSAYPPDKNEIGSINADYFVNKSPDLGELMSKIKLSLERRSG